MRGAAWGGSIEDRRNSMKVGKVLTAFLAANGAAGLPVVCEQPTWWRLIVAATVYAGLLWWWAQKPVES